MRGIARGARITLVVALVVAAQVALGGLVASRPTVAWAALAVFTALVLAVAQPGVVLVAALPCTYLYFRVGVSSTDLSLADVMLGVAVVAALPLVPWGAPMLRRAWKILAVYLLVLAIPVIAVFSKSAAVEWGHRLFLVGGGLVVGAAIAATGRTRAALRAYLVVSGVVAVGAVLDALAHWGSGGLPNPAYPFGIQKNAAGFLLACAIVLLVVMREELAVPRRLRHAALLLLFAGVLACQARGSAITLVAVLVLWSLRERRLRLSPLVVVGAVLLIAMTYVTVTAAYESDARDAQFNSVNSRVATYDAAIELWHHDPLVGVGLKFWRNPAYFGATAFGEPHDLVVSALGESGIAGLGALCFLVGGMLLLLWPRRDAIGMAAFLLVLAHVIDSLVGIYWVAGTMTLGWIVAGVACVDTTARRRADVARTLEVPG